MIHVTKTLRAAALGLATAVLTACGTPSAVEPAATQELSPLDILVGTYTDEASEGLYRMTLNPETGEMTAPELLVETVSPSYAAIADGGRYIYAVNETDEGRVVVYRRAGDGTLELVNWQSSRGSAPCYLALSPRGDRLATANYMTGNMSVFDLDASTGAIGADPQVFQHKGRGPVEDRQSGPHAHWVQWSPSGNQVYVVDLGIDEVKVHAVVESGRLGPAKTAIALTPGAGPRHMVFHPSGRLVYILNELDNTVVAARREVDGTLTATQTLSTLPASFNKHSQAAHIAISPDGRFLYASNRGHDSIAVFAIDNDGAMTLVQLAGVQGEWPRNFLLLPEHDALLVANKDSDNIVLFKVAADGRLTPAGRQVSLSKPVYLDRLPRAR